MKSETRRIHTPEGGTRRAFSSADASSSGRENLALFEQSNVDELFKGNLKTPDSSHTGTTYRPEVSQDFEGKGAKKREGKEEQKNSLISKIKQFLVKEVFMVMSKPANTPEEKWRKYITKALFSLCIFLIITGLTLLFAHGAVYTPYRFIAIILSILTMAALPSVSLHPEKYKKQPEGKPKKDLSKEAPKPREKMSLGEKIEDFLFGKAPWEKPYQSEAERKLSIQETKQLYVLPLKILIGGFLFVYLPGLYIPGFHPAGVDPQSFLYNRVLWVPLIALFITWASQLFARRKGKKKELDKSK